MSAIRRCIDTQIKKGYVKDADKAMKELEQLKASCDGWKNSAETAYKRVMDLSAERDGMREMLKDTQTTLNYIGGNTDDIVLAEAAYGQEKEAAAVLAKYPGGEK
jgi:uncharacterized coiled-coil DUF342 family protein